jgi:hypothetical protein
MSKAKLLAKNGDKAREVITNERIKLAEEIIEAKDQKQLTEKVLSCNFWRTNMRKKLVIQILRINEKIT